LLPGSTERESYLAAKARAKKARTHGQTFVNIRKPELHKLLREGTPAERRQALTELSKLKKVQRGELIERPASSTKPTSPVKRMAVGGAALLGGGAVAGVAGSEYLRKRKQNPYTKYY